VDYAIGWPFGDSMCRLVQYLIHVSTYGSVYTLVLLSLDRYLAVVYPVRSIGMRTVCNTSIAIGISWAIVCTSCVPILFVYFVKVRYGGYIFTLRVDRSKSKLKNCRLCKTNYN
jgi:hypothetical protein